MYIGWEGRRITTAFSKVKNIYGIRETKQEGKIVCTITKEIRGAKVLEKVRGRIGVELQECEGGST